jgi:hypothetical protein
LFKEEGLIVANTASAGSAFGSGHRYLIKKFRSKIPVPYAKKDFRNYHRNSLEKIIAYLGAISKKNQIQENGN